MEVTLALIGLAGGILVALVSWLAGKLAPPGPGAEERPRITPGLYVGLALTLAFFALTLPKAPPFSPGQGLGWGFLIGALITLVAAVGCARLGRPEASYWPYSGGLALSLAVAAVSLTLLLFRGNPADALAGCALGVVAVAGVFRVMSAHLGDGSVPRFVVALEGGAILAVILSAGSVLAVYHFNSSMERGWWAYLPALAALWLAGHAASYVASAQRRLGKYPLALLALAAALGVIVVLAVAGALDSRMDPAQSLEALLVSGLVTAALVVWLAASAPADQAQWPRVLQSAALMAALVLFLVVLSFKLLAGFGSAVALVAAWAVAAAAMGLGGAPARAPVLALAVGANYLLLRLFLERTGAAVGEAEMAIHYALIGTVVGIAVPFVFSSLYMRPGLRRTLLLGALGGLLPLAVLALWGPDAMLGLLAGLVAAQVIGLMLTPLGAASPQAALWQAPVGLWALGTALVTVQASRTFAFLYQMPRAGKAYVAAGIAVVAVAWVIGLGLAQLRRARRTATAEPSGAGEER